MRGPPRVSGQVIGGEAWRPLTPELETALYRMVQEALTSVALHARVRRVTVLLWANQDARGVQIEDKPVSG